MIDRAKELFARVAQQHGLRIEWDADAPVEIAAEFPKQPGLDFPLWVNLQNNDEIWISSDLFTASWFPFCDADIEAKFVSALDGLISGQVRLLCSYGPISAAPHKVILERWLDGRWEAIYRYGRFGFLCWPAKTRVVVNKGARSLADKPNAD